MKQKHFPLVAMMLFFFVVVMSSQEAQAQCKSFIKVSCLPQLKPYIHDGNFQAVVMSEGEEAEIYKTVFSGQSYRLFICIDDNIPTIEFVVSDIRRNILYDNRKNDNLKVWDFKPEVSQQIKVTIRIPKSQKQGVGEQEYNYGCVAILFSLLEQ